MRFVSVTLAIAAILTTPAFAGEREQATVKAREAAYYRAYVDADTTVFADIIADGFSYQHPSGATLSEEQFLDLFRSGTLRVTRADAPNSTVLDYGRTIVTFGQSAVEATVGGQAANGTIRFVNVWRRDGNTWRLAHRNSEFLPPSAQ